MLEWWALEASTPTSLLRSGAASRLHQDGDITIKGYHARTPRRTPARRGRSLADGRAFARRPHVWRTMRLLCSAQASARSPRGLKPRAYIRSDNDAG